MEQVRFTASYTHTRKKYILFLDSFIKSIAKVFLGIVFVSLVLHTIPILLSSSQPQNAFTYFICIGFSISVLYRYHKAYQKSLEVSNGLPWSCKIRFSDTGFQSEYSYDGKVIDHTFEECTGIFRIKSMLVLLLEGNKCTVLDLCSLNDGTLAEFLQFLQEKCPALEGKPVRHRHSLFWANWGILICAGICLVCSLIPGPAFQPRMMTVEESAAVLEELEIPVGQVHIDMMLEDQQKYDLPERADWIPNLLFYAGFDFYDENLNDTPKTPGIYSFDIEAWDVGNMYTKFLHGLSEASEGALVFEDIVEDESFENLENGTGSKTISFTFRGERYTVEARMLADWMDTKALTEIAKIVNSSDKEKQLWFFSADGQIISVFYRNKAWANQFMRLTGHRLTNDLRWMLMG